MSIVETSRRKSILGKPRFAQCRISRDSLTLSSGRIALRLAGTAVFAPLCFMLTPVVLGFHTHHKALLAVLP